MKKFYILTCFLFFSVISYQQQWSGSTGITGDIGRTGNVGVGTTSPLTTLHVAGGKLFVSSTTGGSYGQFQLVNPNDAEVSMTFGAGGSGLISATNLYTRQWSVGINPYGTGLDNFTITNSTLTNQGFVFTKTGKFGIGTNSPASTLHVSGGKIVVLSTSSSYGQLQVLNSSDAEASIAYGANGTGIITSGTTYSREWVTGINSYAVGLTNFTITNPTLQGNGFVFTTSGNLLIGKNTQVNTAYKLDVNGDVRANKIVVNTTGADFVFDSAYKLPSLESIELYIKEHNHLPGIASAKEMQNGLDIGEINTKLLQKVEELTLYVIELKKQNEQIKKELEMLSEKK